MSLSQFSAEIYKNASKIGIHGLNTLQKSSVSGILNNDNSIILSEAGSGKSSSYILALSQLLSHSNVKQSSNYLKSTSTNLLFTEPSPSPKGSSHGALVLVPTQELSLQLYKSFRQIAP